jgi:hypothetical protein
MANRLAYLNRDQIVLVTLYETGLVLTTTLGANIFVSGSSDTLNEFTDQLVNAVGSNYVAIPKSANLSSQNAGGQKEGKTWPPTFDQ